MLSVWCLYTERVNADGRSACRTWGGGAIDVRAGCLLRVLGASRFVWLPHGSEYPTSVRVLECAIRRTVYYGRERIRSLSMAMLCLNVDAMA